MHPAPSSSSSFVAPVLPSTLTARLRLTPRAPAGGIEAEETALLSSFGCGEGGVPLALSREIAYEDWLLRDATVAGTGPGGTRQGDHRAGNAAAAFEAHGLQFLAWTDGEHGQRVVVGLAAEADEGDFVHTDLSLPVAENTEVNVFTHLITLLTEAKGQHPISNLAATSRLRHDIRV